jgi:hypothetical protein
MQHGAGHASHQSAAHSGHAQMGGSEIASIHDCGDGGDPCGFHAAQDLAAQASVAASVKAPAQTLLVALVTEAPALPALGQYAGIRSSNLGWLPPPGSSPVSLKTRLLN